MTPSRYQTLGFPFISPTSFYNVGIGTEKLTFRPEWAGKFGDENEHSHGDCRAQFGIGPDGGSDIFDGHSSVPQLSGPMVHADAVFHGSIKI